MTAKSRNSRSVARPEAVAEDGVRAFDLGDQFTLARSFANPLQVSLDPPTGTDAAVASDPQVNQVEPGGEVEAFQPTNPDDEVNGGTLELDGVIHHVYADVGGFSYVFVAGGDDDGVSVFRLNQNGTLTPVHDVTDDASMALNGARGLSTAMVDGNTYLFVSGQADAGVSVFRVNTNGSLTHIQQVLDNGTMFLLSVNATATARVGTSTYLFTAGQGDDGISTFRVAGDGRLTNVANLADTGAIELDGVSDLHAVTIGGTTFLLAVGNTDDGISVFSVGANGTLTHINSITDSGALELDGAFEVTSATVNGTVYVYIAGNADNGITVYSMNGAGTLTHVQDITDDANMRLTGVGSLSVLSFGGHQYLSASGGESGISLFRIGAGGTGNQLGVPGTLTFIGNILDDANVNIGGFTTVSSAQVGGTTHLIGGGFTDDGVSVFGSSMTGQLFWFGQGGAANGRLAYVNNDGFNHINFVDSTPSNDLLTQFPQEVGVDAAAGFYYALVNGGNDGTGGRLVRGSLNGGPVTTLITFDGVNNIVGDLDDEIVNTIIVDNINERIYLGIQDPEGDDAANTGIRQYSYNPLTGAITDLGWLTTVASSGKPAESGFPIFNPRDFEYDITTGNIFFAELLTGGVQANGLFRLNIATPNTVVQMVSQAQFPDDGSNGFIIDVEVDASTNLVYFSTQSQAPSPGPGYNAAHNAVWFVAENATNATATQLTFVGAPAFFYPGDMVFDQVTRRLYIESEGDASGAGADDNSADDLIYVFQLNAAGTQATLVNTIAADPAFSQDFVNIAGMHFNQIASLTGVTATGNVAGEQGLAVDLLNGAPTIADADHDRLSGATVQITGGFFNSSENSFDDDDLGVGSGMQQSGLVVGTNITVSWNQATGTLTLTGYDTHANYQNVLNNIHFQSTGDNPTNYGLNTTRTITWTVNDGTFGTPGGQQNSAVTQVSILAINDAPVNTPGAAMNFSEDTTGNFGAEGAPPTPVSNAVTGISVFDVDANPGIQDITVTLSVGVGTLTIRTDVAGGITAADVISGNGTGTIVIVATQNEINTTLAAMSPAFTGPPAVAAAPNGLIYTPPANYNGATTLTITTNDNGNTGNDPGLTGTGTTEQDQDVKVINIADVNDAPTVAGDGTEAMGDILEDTPMQQSGTPPPPVAPTVASLFGGQFADLADMQQSVGNPTGSPGDTFAGIAIVADGSTPATGQWEYWNGSAWVDIGAASQGAARTFTAATQIRFNPALNYNGAAPTLTVHLIESGGPAITNNGTVNLSPAGTATGGTTVYSSGIVVLSQNIIAVNDAPVNTVGAPMTVDEDSGATNVTGMSISDVDANPATDIFTVTLDVLNGTLNLSTSVPGGVTAGNVAGNGTATIVLTGTINEINATLAAAGGLTYTPNPNYNGSDRVQITTNDGGATGQDPGLTGTGTSEQDQDQKAITVTAVNDPVTGAAPASLNFDEDAGSVAVTGLSISDIDAALAPAGVYEVTLSATNGTLTLTTLTGLTFTAGDGTSDATMTFHGTLADINTALATASYTADANYNGSATITMNVTDTFGGIVATGTGAATSDTDIVNVTVNAVNDPIGTVGPGAISLAEDSVNFAVTGLSITDVDATLAPAGVYEVTLTATHGTLTLTTLTGLTFTAGDGTADATMTFHGTLADLNTALATTSYTPDPNYNGFDAQGIIFSATDTFGGIVATGSGAATSDTNFINVTVTAVNDTPVVALVPSVASTEQVAGFIDPTATISDVELGALNGGNGDYGGATLSVARNGGSTPNDLLNFGPSGAFTVNGSNLEAPGGLVFATFSGGNGAPLTINFTSTNTAATQALVNAVIQSLQYTYTGDTPPAMITLDYTFDDGAPTNAGQGGGGSPLGTDSIQVNITDTPENQPPVLDLNGGDPGDGSVAAVTEQMGPATLAPNLTVTDADDTDLTGATVVINSPAAGDGLSVAGVANGTSGAISWTWNGTDTLTFTGTASLADYQALLRQVSFEANGDDPGTMRTISWTVNGPTNSSNQPITVVTVTPINDEPTLTATGGTPTFTEGGAAVDLFSTVNVSTVEAGQTITSMTLTVTNVTESNSEVLTIDGSDVALGNGNIVVTSGNGLTVNVSVAGNVATVSFSGASLSAAALAAIIDAMTYRNLSDNPTDADRVITITQLVDSGSNTPPNDNTAEPNISATVNVDPVNDPANITGDAAGDVTEAGGVNNGTPGTPTDTGDLDATDLDNFPADTWQAVAPGGTTTNGYGTYALTAAGVWTYTLDDNNAAVQALNGAATLTDTFTALTADGTAQIVTITIHAQNDAATITGDAAGDVTEAGGTGNGIPGTPTDTGDLNAADVDNSSDAWQAVAAGAATSGGYGTYALTAAGVWTYTLDNNNAAVQALNGAATLTDSFTALTADGTAQVVTVTIHAQNDNPTIANMDGDTVNYVENAAPVALDFGGDALVGDVDSPDLDGGTLQVNISANYNAAQDVLGITTSATITLSNGINTGSIVSVGGTAIGVISAGSPGSQSFTITLNGNANAGNVSTLIHALNYSNSSDNPTTLGGRTIQVSLTDGDGSPATTVSTLVTLTRINDEPTSSNVTINGVSEDDPYTFQVSDFPFNDVDGHSPFTVRFTSLPTDGVILLNGVAIMVNDEIAYSAIASGMLTFQPDLNEFGSPYTSFTFQVRDNGGVVNPGDDDLSATYTATINVTPDNLPPVVDLNGAGAGIDFTTSFTEDGAAVAIGSGIIVSDPDEVPLGDLIERATITITDPVAGDVLTVVGALPPGITVDLVNSTATTLILIGSASSAAYATALGQVRYSTPNQNPDVLGTDTARTVTVVVNDGMIDSAVATATVNIIAVDDPAVAQPDAFTIFENGTIVAGNLFANNGSGTDEDVDGPPLTIAEVNGSALNVGTQIVLASGALLTVNANGTFDYDPNGAFLETPVPGSGASNTPGQDSFTYRLANGNTVTVTITLTGLDTDDVMIGSAGADTLISDGGQDDLYGLAGDDVYHIADASDVVHEVVGEGADIVYVGASYALAAGSSVELLSSNDIGAVTALDLEGNELANFLYGNNGTNNLNGGGGTDYLRGFGGDDYYYVDSADDTTFELAGEGTDVVYTSVSYALAVGSSVELLSANDILATTPLSFLGNELHNLIYGNAGNNVLNGGGGADYLRGNDGDDLYYVDGSIDVVDELAGGGTDIIYTGGTYVLAAASSVEILSANDINANVAMDLGGNELVNLIYGNAAGNTINGGAGADYMRGNAGDDIYHVDNAGDVVDESGGQGTDIVYTQVSYALAAGSSVEILSAADLSSTDPIDLSGNELANYIIGNAGNNTLNGGGGADLLVGRGGNDIYYVGSGAAQVIEDAGGGNDTVYTSVSYTLAAGQEIELLLAQDMAGSDPINLTGNEYDNTLYGNNGANVLDGKGGNDNLIGLSGADTFAFTTALGATNVDVVFGFDHGIDKIALDDAIFTAIGAPGALNANAFVVGSAAADASDRIIYNSLTGQLFYDADGNGAGAAIQFATMSPGLTLTASDFQVI